MWSDRPSPIGRSPGRLGVTLCDLTWLLVGVGGLAGVLSRYGLSLVIESIWTVVAINIAGSFALGLVLTAGSGWSEEVRDAIGIGFLGGFTTFSTLTVQTVLEADGGRSGTAATYLAITVIGGMAAAVAGYLLGKAIA